MSFVKQLEAVLNSLLGSGNLTKGEVTMYNLNSLDLQWSKTSFYSCFTTLLATILFIVRGEAI